MKLAAASGDFASALAAYERFRSIFDNPKWESFTIGREVWQNIAIAFLNLGHSILQTTPSSALGSLSLPTHRSVRSRNALQIVVERSCSAEGSPMLRS